MNYSTITNGIFGVLLATCTILLIITVLPTAEAVISLGSHSTGIVLSKTCATLISSNMSSACPGYEGLITLDNSNRKWTGEFEADQYGNLWRIGTAVKNSHLYYQFDGIDQYRIFVDPPKEYTSRVKLITIENNFDVYIDRRDTNVYNYTVIQYHDWWVDKRCREGKINADRWMELLPAMMYYLRGDCKVEKAFNNVRTFEIILQNHDITTSSKYKLEQWQKYIIQNCLQDYSKCKDLEQPSVTAGKWVP